MSRLRSYPEEGRSVAGHQRDGSPEHQIIAGVGSQAFEEGKELVRRLEAPGRNVRRGDAVQRLLLQLEVGMDVDLGGPDVLMAFSGVRTARRGR